MPSQIGQRLAFTNAANAVKRAGLNPGGAVLSGLEIGRQIKSKKLMTAVPSSTLCASSCALIWLAGATRFAEDSSIVGFHAAYVIKNGKQVET